MRAHAEAALEFTDVLQKEVSWRAKLVSGASREFCGAGRVAPRVRCRNPASVPGCQREVRSSFNRVVIVACVAALVCGVSATARADLWGCVDDTGVARISNEQRDDCYQLFLRGGASVRAPDADAAADAAAAAAEAQARAAFERTPAFRRVMNHRNAGRFESLIEQHAKSQQLDPALVKAVIAVESAFEPEAVSVKGAVGLMQVTPETGERYGVAGDAKRSVEQKLREPAINLRVGTRYLHDLLALFADNLELALAAYNAGEKTVKRYANTIPPFAETRAFVKLVQQFQSAYGPAPPPPEAPVRIAIPGQGNAVVSSFDTAQ